MPLSAAQPPASAAELKLPWRLNRGIPRILPFKKKKLSYVIQLLQNFSEMPATLDKDDCEKLIELVRINEVIYDASHEDYKDAQLVQHVWTNIASAMGKNDLDGKYRLLSLVSRRFLISLQVY